MEAFLKDIVKHTNGWVIVVVFALYVGYQIYQKHAEGAALSKTLNILDEAINNHLKNIDDNITRLITTMNNFLSKLGVS